MREPTEKQGRVFGVSPGADFVECLHGFLCEQARDQAPEAFARIQVLVPTRRMQRRLKHLFEQTGACLLPKIGLVSDVSHLLPDQAPMRQVSGLRRILELKAAVARLVELDQRLSENDVIELATSLTKLLDEMHGEGVSFDRLEALSPEDHSGHWNQSLGFLRAIRDYVATLGDEAGDPEAAHRATVERLIQSWAENPPQHPIVIAGSTGSRATTALLMGAAAGLPQGSVLLPGFDFDLPNDIWTSLARDRSHEDHPQYRFAAFLSAIDRSPWDVVELGKTGSPARNRLISLSLRPAPVTDQWLTHGPKLGSLLPATANLSLIEARDPKEEAAAIALAIRTCLARHQTVALIAPDATLARRVTSELKRWNLTPDDSGGMPLSLSPEGRFMRQTARLAGGQRDPVEVMSLLKHPLTQAGEDRGRFMKDMQEFELFLRKTGCLQIDAQTIELFFKSHEARTDWLRIAFDHASTPAEETLGGALDLHQRVIAAIAGETGLKELFTSDAGEKAKAILDDFAAQADLTVRTRFSEYSQLLENALSAESSRAQQGVRSDVMIWGTLEARVQGAEVVILGGLNEGVWPAQPAADPWLNRAMRREVGLLLPERQIGLAAHDYQQAIGAESVILSRSARDEGSETVPSRWLSRLINLLDGLPETDGKEALGKMRARGTAYLDQAAMLDRPSGDPEPEPRPAPAPPLAIRPRDFAVTEIQNLIRDPYAIYAKRVLQVRPLNPLVPEMDSRLKGTLIHGILEDFYAPDVKFHSREDAIARLSDIARARMENAVLDQTTRVAWLSQLMANADWLFEEEVQRRQRAEPLVAEIKGRFQVPGSTFVLRGKADRIDRLKTGGLIIYDYKTGTPPSHKDIRLFDRQLVLEAAMVEAGAFEDLAPEPTAYVAHIGVGRSPKEQITKLENENAVALVPEQITSLLSSYLASDCGYLSRRAMETLRYDGDYDHLARFGEWDATMVGQVVQVQ